MKIAVLSDIHGNIAALDAVLEDVEQRGADMIVNLGDICSGPLFPNETADLLMRLDLPTIKGNHERQLLTMDRDIMGPSDRYAAERLTVSQLAWLDSLPDTLRLTDEVAMVHGSPDSDLQYFLHSVEPDGLREASVPEIIERAGALDAAVILCGHTHLPRYVMLPDGRMILNPGSVGLQAYKDDHPFPHKVEMQSPHARYAIIERHAGSWRAEFILVQYDWDEAALHAEEQGRADWSTALRTGFA